MYNLPEDPNSRHPKGRGNGYLITVDDKQIYISGDTGDIQEMRMLQNIDVAFVCMNLPYTMTIEKAASAVLEFQPKLVYPFHYRGQFGRYCQRHVYQPRHGALQTHKKGRVNRLYYSK